MKVGDLVKFSAYGKKLQCNRNVARHDPLGIIIRSDTWIYVKWSGLVAEDFMFGDRKRYTRQDLKYASR
mgnify:CR=1 FL=1